MPKASRQVTICSWNINGAYKRLDGQRVCKLDEDIFKENMNSDIIFLCETHLSLIDNLYYDGYKFFSNCRTMKPSKSKGGLGLFIKQTLLKGVKIVDKSHSEYVWVKLCHKFFGFQRDIYIKICFLYIPPINLSYTRRTGLDKIIFDKLESDIS